MDGETRRAEDREKLRARMQKKRFVARGETGGGAFNRRRGGLGKRARLFRSARAAAFRAD
jgi:hypothetical protein